MLLQIFHCTVQGKNKTKMGCRSDLVKKSNAINNIAIYGDCFNHFKRVKILLISFLRSIKLFCIWLKNILVEENLIRKLLFYNEFYSVLHEI